MFYLNSKIAIATVFLFFLTLGIMPNSTNGEKLCKAARKNDLATLEILLKGGLNPNQKNKLGQTPIECAIGPNDNGKAITLLIKYGANPNQIDSYGRAHIVSTALTCSINSLKALVYGKANLDAKDKKGRDISKILVEQMTSYAQDKSTNALMQKLALDMFNKCSDSGIFLFNYQAAHKKKK